MVRYVIKRVILALITAVIILSLTFILMKLVPMERMAGSESTLFAYYEKQVSLGYMVSFKGVAHPELGDLYYSYTEKGTTYYYYVKPVMQQYINWIGNIVTKWDWGVSQKIEPNVNVTVMILERLGVTIKVNFLSIFISIPLGIAIGILAALRKNKPTDHVISTGIMILNSIPGFILLTLLMLLLCYNNHWLPTQWPSETASAKTKFLGYLIPLIYLSSGSIAGYARTIRAELCEVMASEYLLLARTKGLTRKQAIMRHALRNALVPIFPGILLAVFGLLSGATILEKIYGINGIGKLYIDAFNGKDYNVLFVDMAIFTTMGLLTGVLADISYGFIDPRIRMGAKK